MRKTLFTICFYAFVTASPALAGLEAGIEAYRAGDYRTAFGQLSDDGSAQALFLLAMMYEKGYGVRADRDASLELLRSAAEQGLDVAQADLGLRYLDGMGVELDEEVGMKWLQKAARQGLAEAQAAMRMAGREQ